MIRNWMLILMALLMAGCGGGGGGSSSSGSGSSGGGGADTMSFSPGTVSLSYPQGSPLNFSVTATPGNPGEFSGMATLYIAITDTQGILNKSYVPTFSVQGNSFTQTEQTSSTLPVGSYQGNFQVTVCSDSSCSTPLPGSPWTLPYNIQVTPAVLVAKTTQPTTVSMPYEGAAPTPLNFNVQGAGLTWSVSTSVPWLQSSVTGGTGAGGFAISYATSNLAEGNYTGSVTVQSTDGQTVVTPVTLSVLPPEFDFSSGTATFTAVNGAPIATQTINLGLDSNANVPWTATANQPWLSTNPTAGVTPGSISLSVNPSVGALASGAYSANVLVTAKGLAQATIPVTLNLIKANLAASPTSVTFGGALGRSFSAQSVLLSVNTGSNSWPWAFNALPSWLSASSANSTVGQTGSTISLTPNMQSAPIGTSNVVVNATAQVNGDALSTPINATINVDQHRLLPSENGIAFTSIPTWSRLTHNITVVDNFGNTANWTAQSNQPWLTVTPSGTTSGIGSVISLTANPNSLSSNSMNYATVTITSSDPTAQPAIINVGLWNGSTAPASMTKLQKTYIKLVADKIRPYVYAHNGSNFIDIYNAYTAQLVGTIGGLGTALGDMTLSGDGSRLYAIDTASQTVVAVDLVGQKLLNTWRVKYPTTQTTHLISVHPNGKELVLLSDLTFYTSDGVYMGTSGIGSSMAATSDGKNIFNTNNIPGQFFVDYSEVTGGVLMVNTLTSSVFDENVIGFEFQDNTAIDADIAVSPDGTKVYSTVGALNACSQSTASPTNAPKYIIPTYVGALPGGAAYPNNVKVGVDGRIYCGASGPYNSVDVWMYSSSGTILSTYKFVGSAQTLLGKQLAITSDGLLMTGLTSDPYLVFVAVGP